MSLGEGRDLPLLVLVVITLALVDIFPLLDDLVSLEPVVAAVTVVIPVVVGTVDRTVGLVGTVDDDRTPLPPLVGDLLLPLVGDFPLEGAEGLLPLVIS